MQIIQIVPRLPPAVDGVGDYALTLARNLEHHHGVRTAWVVCDPANRAAAETQSAGQVTVLPRRDARSLIEAIDSLGVAGPLLLQYVQYGYQAKGCPLWLDRALHRLCTGEAARPLVTMFHEIYAPGHFPDSAFWLQPVQKAIARRLARLSQGCATSRESYAHLLAGWRRNRGEPPANLPIPSGVGEPGALLDFSTRRHELIVFGLRATRALAYREFAPELARVCRQLGLEKIVDIGPELTPVPTAVDGVPVETLGSLPTPAVAARLSAATAGFLAYDLAYLGRSSVFAAYCAYGLTPVCVHLRRPERASGAVRCQDGLQSGVHFWENEPYAAASLTLTTARTVADRARAWYQTHDQAAHAAHFNALLRRSTEAERQKAEGRRQK